MERPALRRGRERRLRLGPRRDRHEEPGGGRGGRRRAPGARRGPFAGELLFIATADEERGDYCGARWLATQRPELVRCDYLLNEGGGTYSVADGARLYPLTVGEKAFADFRITVRGRGGHGSVPLHDLQRRRASRPGDHRYSPSTRPASPWRRSRPATSTGSSPTRPARPAQGPGPARAAVRELLAADPEPAYRIEPLLA